MSYYFAYLVALISLSQASVIIRWSQENPLILGGWRLLFASLILRFFFELSSKLHFTKNVQLKNASNVKKIKLTRNQIQNILIIGFVFFVHLFSYAFAAHSIPVNYLMLIYSCNPVFTAIANMIMFKEPIKFKHCIAFVFSFLGIYVLVRGVPSGFSIINKDSNSISIIGVGSAVLAALTFSIYSIFSKKVRKELPNSLVTSLFYGVASCCFFISILSIGLTPIPMELNKGWVAIFLLALFPTILGHSVFTYCMNHIDIQILSIGKLIEPIFAAISAYFILGEPITFSHFIAFLLISIGIGALFINKKAKLSK